MYARLNRESIAGRMQLDDLARSVSPEKEKRPIGAIGRHLLFDRSLMLVPGRSLPWLTLLTFVLTATANYCADARQSGAEQEHCRWLRDGISLESEII